MTTSTRCPRCLSRAFLDQSESPPEFVCISGHRWVADAEFAPLPKVAQNPPPGAGMVRGWVR